ncbi:2' O-ribose methyltransferase [Tilletia horrida]|nr:2' O-ribose methyltransferase [Tilletia horrida]
MYTLSHECISVLRASATVLLVPADKGRFFLSIPSTTLFEQYVKLRKQGQSPVSGVNSPLAPPVYASRAAFKLAQLDDIHKFLRHDAGARHPRIVVDLGAAPGGWTQIAVERLTKDRSSSKPPSQRTQIYALDILPMSPVEGATFIQGDFLDPDTQQKLEEAILTNAGGHSDGLTDPRPGPGSNASQPARQSNGGLVDVVLSDMMAPTTGNVISDTEASLDLCRAAFFFALRNLRESDRLDQFFVCKFFGSPAADHFRKRVLEPAFHKVKVEKGRIDASRKESKEAFWVCQGFRGATSVDLNAIYGDS